MIFESDPFEVQIEKTILPLWGYYLAPIFVLFFFGILFLPFIGLLFLLRWSRFQWINLKLNIDTSLYEFRIKIERLFLQHSEDLLQLEHPNDFLEESPNQFEVDFEDPSDLNSLYIIALKLKAKLFEAHASISENDKETALENQKLMAKMFCSTDSNEDYDTLNGEVFNNVGCIYG